jgi:hypothetical protein
MFSEATVIPKRKNNHCGNYDESLRHALDVIQIKFRIWKNHQEICNFLVDIEKEI